MEALIAGEAWKITAEYESSETELRYRAVSSAKMQRYSTKRFLIFAGLKYLCADTTFTPKAGCSADS